MLVHDWPLLQWDDGFRRRGPVSKGTVWAFGIVVLTPLLDDNLCFLQRVEDFTVEQFVPEAGVEAFAVPVFPR